MKEQIDMFGTAAEQPKPVIQGHRLKHPYDIDLELVLPAGKIISIRGTSGSGKTHCVRRVMEHYRDRVPVYAEGRNNPLYYLLYHNQSKVGQLAVLGSYENKCGGCDGIAGTEYIFSLVTALALSGRDVMFEGLMLAMDVKHTKVMNLPTWALFLNTPLETCLDAVRQRRVDRGDDRPLNPENTESKYKGTSRAFERAKEMPLAQCFMVSRDEAYAKCVEVLGL